MQGPLAGLNVLDLSAFVAGPLCGAILADYGASVIKVERPVSGDLQREVGSRRNKVSGFHQVLNRGKRSLAIDLSSDEGRRAVHTISKRCDVVLQNFRPGVTKRLGVDYDSLKKINDHLVYLSISGFGASGPRHKQRAYDPIIQFLAGIASVQGGRGNKPVQVRQLLVDKLTGHAGAQAVLAALVSRGVSGQGQHVEVSMFDVAISFIWSDAASQQILRGEGIELFPPSGAAGFIAEFADGWGVLFAISDEESRDLMRALKLDDLVEDPRIATIGARRENIEFLRQVYRTRVAQAAKALSLREAEKRFIAHDVPFAPARSLQDLPQDPQVIHSGTLRAGTHPIAGDYLEAKLPALFSQTPASAACPAPSVGQHTREVLSEYGFSDSEIDDWQSRDMISSS